MIDEKKLGIWVTHTAINLIGFMIDPIKAVTIQTLIIHPDKVGVFNNAENTHQNDEAVAANYYHQKICENIKAYEEVVIFGDIEAHKLLVAILRIDKQFKDIKIGVEKTDSLTENEQHAFVREYFSRYYCKS